MRMLLVPLGSEGDVLPFLWLGEGLRERGHEVLVIANEHFEQRVLRTGLGFVALGTREHYKQVVDTPDLWNPRRSFFVWSEHVVIPSMRPMYELIQQHYIPGKTLVVACGFAFGARIAHEKLGVPLVTIHLQPSMLRSVHDRPLISGLPMTDWMPRVCLRWMYAAVDRLVSDRVLAPATNALRAELGLPPVRRLLDAWWHSPQRVIGLFPDWFAAVQPDWPACTCQTGFPLCDGAALEPCPPEVAAFLAAGPPPIVFTPGSAMRHADSFFAASVEACRALNARGVLLTRFAEQVPANLPDSIVRFEYVPFGQLFPRASAVVHHGGVGTASQALAAGVPQLVVPFAADQPDNARRLQRMGVARSLSIQRYAPRHIASSLDDLTRSPMVAQKCREAANKLSGYNALGQTCALIEELAG